ncbi:MAG: RES family NAD+ phosphorylase [Deltaproteobacteria bacterium]|nr:RES family NAD+ phosphorylase [Deltaproteobacteria bacterium]
MGRKRARSETAKQKKRIRVRTQSHRTGIVQDHSVKALTAIAREAAQKQAARLKADMVAGSIFWKWLETKTVTPVFESWDKTVFRIVYAGLDPLSVAGSLSAGGRFNVGGAQMQQHDLFPRLTMAACLYVASSIKCARKEAGEPLGNAEEYELAPKTSLHLWQLEKVAVQLDYPGLLDLILATPMMALWSMQKAPLISQLLGNFLRMNGGDGIVFTSTKDSSEKVVAVFAKDDGHAKSLFTSKRIN